jgi:uncharacterized protein YndB with AHSA1/START domain
MVGDDRVTATMVLNASAQATFAVLADPTKHAAIDGTGWVCEAIDREALTVSGQIFRMAMHHPGHPTCSYEMANRVQALDPPRAISWEPGNEADDGIITYPGWVWHYELTPVGPSATEVTLTYDWSAVPVPIREHIGFPPFPDDHLDNSLAHLAALVVPHTAPTD